MIKTKWGLGPTAAKYARIVAFAAVVLGVIGIFGLSARGNVPLGLGDVVVQPEPVPAWVQRIALVAASAS